MRKYMLLGLMCTILSCGNALAADSIRFDFTPSFVAQSLEKQKAEQIALPCERCAAPPKIDGVLDDAAWQKAARVPDFGDSACPTEVKVCFDDKSIYIGVVCKERPGRTPKGQESARDSAVYHDDCIEIWLKPFQKDDTVCHFIVNIAGSIYDSRSGNAAYDPEWLQAVARREDGWILEAAVPYKSLGLDAPNGRIGFNIGRNGPGLEPRSWHKSWGDAAGSALILKGIPELVEVEKEAVFECSPQLAIRGTSLGVRLERFHARPGERWIEAKLKLKPEQESLARTELTARLFELGKTAPVETLSVVPAREQGRLLVDLRGKNLTAAKVSLELLEGDKSAGVAEMFLTAQGCSTPLLPGEKIAVEVDLPEGIGAVDHWPVTFGVPFAPGALWDEEQLRVVDAEGKEVPSQKEVTGRWGWEGSVKWVRFDALVTVPASKYFVEAAAPTKASLPANALTVSEEEGVITVNTGVARYVLGKGSSPIMEIWMGERRIAASKGARGLYVIDQAGNLAAADADEESMLIEARGPVASSVRFEGFYKTADGARLARHVTRIECAAGKPFANVTHTLVLTKDSNETWFKEIGWEFAVDSAAAGSNPTALFGVSRADWQKTYSQPLNSDTPSAYMLQDSHYFFAHGTNHFVVAAIDKQGKSNVLLEGGAAPKKSAEQKAAESPIVPTLREVGTTGEEECGDWAALAGKHAGLQVNCRDAARLHPKEFEVFPGKIALKLFSNRAGEELDFRGPALVEKWDLETWYSTVCARRDLDKKAEFIDAIRNYKSNAAGWARTHLLMINPILAEGAAETAAKTSRLHSEMVYAHIDPWWMYESKALGPNYPRDPERFPATERLLDDALKWWINADAAWGEHGFVDYFAGPHLSYKGRYVPMFRYAWATYTLRKNLWLMYARSGDRGIRAFAEGSNRTQMDGLHAHWDTPTNTKGLHRSSAQFGLPFYWGSRSDMEISSSSDLNGYLAFYHLTGYRRARECVEEWAEGMKRYWTPAKAKQTSRILMLTRLLAQAYGLTWDPALKELAEATTDIFEDREGELFLSKERPYHSSSYKTNVDIRALLDAWNILGAPRYHDIAWRVAGYWWRKHLPGNVYSYCAPAAVIGNFFYNETKKPVYAQALAVAVRNHAASYDPEKDNGVPEGIRCAAYTAFSFEIGYALDVLVRSGADRKQLASWICFNDATEPATVIVRKSDEETVDLQFRSSGVRIRAVNPSTSWGLDLNRVTEIMNSGCGDLRIPKDGQACDYEITFSGSGNHQLFADSPAQMVLHAPDYWLPLPGQKPAVKYYFKLPEGSKDAQIFFEGSAKLFTPEDKPYKAGESFHGWTDIPAEMPGLWSFASVTGGLVRARNFPPFFAAGSPETFFMPEAIKWEREEAVRAVEELSPDTIYARGACEAADDQGIYLAGKRTFTVKSGPDHPSGDGGLFLPHKQGTIEFWMKPQWDSVGMPDGEKWLILGRMKGDGGGGKYLCLRYEKKGPTKQLYSYIDTDGREGKISVRNYYGGVYFDRNEWAHIALVWGQRRGIGAYLKPGENTFTIGIYVNGKGRRAGQRGQGNYPIHPFGEICLGYYSNKLQASNIDAVVDELRISDIQRYDANFTPPPRSPFAPDEHTRALFHFNGNLKGESCGTEEALEGIITGGKK